jgi:very-short-patch-repair endonuclease
MKHLERDLYKMNCANKNGFSIIRIIQEDIYKNKYDWLNELTNNIEKITQEKIVQNIYMCKNNEYKDFGII